VRISEQTKAGALARFEALNAQLSEKVEDVLWSIREENVEAVTRALEAGSELTKIFEHAVVTGAITIDDLFDTNYVEIPGSNPVQYRTKFLDCAARAAGGIPRQGQADGVLRHRRSQRLPAGAQQDVLPSAASGGRRLEYRQQPQSPHLQ
jgi:hypothetical protein